MKIPSSVFHILIFRTQMKVLIGKIALLDEKILFLNYFAPAFNHKEILKKVNVIFLHIYRIASTFLCNETICFYSNRK